MGGPKQSPSSFSIALSLPYTVQRSIFTCLATTFCTAVRLGKFMVRNPASFNGEAHIKLTDVRARRGRQKDIPKDVITALGK